MGKSISFVGHCHQEEIIEDDRRNQNLRKNKIKIIKHFAHHCGKGSKFNNDYYERFISVVIKILKGIIEKKEGIK